jgi:hypothetical protein
MGTEDIVIAIGAFVLGALLLKKGTLLLRTREELTPVSRQWLLEQRVQEDQK